MNWQDVRIQYPETWLLVEATAAHWENDFRILDDLLVVESFEDSNLAWTAYSNLHKKEPEREVIILHTSNEEIILRAKGLLRLGLRGLR